MTQCHIIKRRKNRGVNIVYASYGYFFRIRSECSRYKLMSQNYISFLYIYFHPLNNRLNCFLISIYIYVRNNLLYICRLNKRKQINVYFSICIMKSDRLWNFLKNGGNIYSRIFRISFLQKQVFPANHDFRLS